MIILVEGWGSKSNAFAPSALFFFVKYLYAALPSLQVTAADRWPSQCPLQGTQSSTGGNKNDPERRIETIGLMIGQGTDKSICVLN